MKSWNEIDGDDIFAIRQQHMDIAAETTGAVSEYHAAMAASYFEGDVEFNAAMELRDNVSVEIGNSPLGIRV